MTKTVIPDHIKKAREDVTHLGDGLYAAREQEKDRDGLIDSIKEMVGQNNPNGYNPSGYDLDPKGRRTNESFIAGAILKGNLAYAKEAAKHNPVEEAIKEARQALEHLRRGYHSEYSNGAPGTESMEGYVVRTVYEQAGGEDARTLDPNGKIANRDVVNQALHDAHLILAREEFGDLKRYHRPDGISNEDNTRRVQSLFDDIKRHLGDAHEDPSALGRKVSEQTLKDLKAEAVLDWKTKTSSNASKQHSR